MSTPHRPDSPPPTIIVATPAQITDLVRAAVADAIADLGDGASRVEHAVDTAGIAQILGVSIPTARRMDLPHIMCGDHRRYLPSVVLLELQRRAQLERDAGERDGGGT